MSQAVSFIPLGFVLKYDPPVIGLYYRPSNVKGKDQGKRKVYTIHLNNLIFLAEPEDILEALFQEHPNFLDPQIVKPEQVFKLVLRLVAYRDSQLQGMGAFVTDGQGEEYYEDDQEGEEYADYTEAELEKLQREQMFAKQKEAFKQQMGGGKGNKNMDVNNRSF